MYSSLQPRWQLSLQGHTWGYAAGGRCTTVPRQESLPLSGGSSSEEAPPPCPVRAGPAGPEPCRSCVLLRIQVGGREGRGRAPPPAPPAKRQAFPGGISLGDGRAGGPCAELVAGKAGREGQEDVLSGSEIPGGCEQVDGRVAHALGPHCVLVVCGTWKHTFVLPWCEGFIVGTSGV